MTIGLTIALALFYLFIVFKQLQFLLCFFGPGVIIVLRFYNIEYPTLIAGVVGALAGFFGYVFYAIISVFLTGIIYTCPSRHCGIIIYPIIGGIISLGVNLLFSLEKK